MSAPTFYRLNLESLTPDLYNAYLIKGSIGYMIVNSSLTFILFMLLALIYRKNNNIVTK